MGIQKDLNMKSNDFSWGATAFFVGYAISELPQGKIRNALFLSSP